MLKLGRYLFLHEHNATYMDDYERGIFNMIAGSRADQRSSDDPLLTYFQPLTPGSSREYGNTGTCCGGTGMESHTKYQETVYLRSSDGSTLYVNLYIPSQLNWAEKGFIVKQETTFPRSDSSKLTITGSGGPLDIQIRVPGWARKGFQVAVNGQTISTPAVPGSYLSVSRTWKQGDTVTISMPFALRTERALDRPEVQALMWGPLLLQTVGTPPNGQTYHQLSLYRYLRLDGDYSRAALTRDSKTGNPIFTVTGSSGLKARPYYISDTKPVSSYFQRVEPTVIFASQDTKVPNRKRNDGLPNYDVPVTNVTSPGTDGPTFLDVLWDGAPFESHDTFVKMVEDLVEEWVGKGVYGKQEGDKIVKGAKDAGKELEAM